MNPFNIDDFHFRQILQIRQHMLGMTPPSPAKRFDCQMWCIKCDSVVHSDWMGFTDDGHYWCDVCRKTRTWCDCQQCVANRHLDEYGMLIAVTTGRLHHGKVPNPPTVVSSRTEAPGGSETVFVSRGSRTETMTAQQYRERFVQ